MLNRDEILNYLKSENDELFQIADKIRKENKGNGVHLRGLIEFSNICKRSCLYCGLRAGNKNIQRYRLDEEEIIQIAKKGISTGYKTIVLQSGEDDDYYTKDKLCKIIENIKKFDVALTLSIGERSLEDYRAFKNAGADRYLLRIETTDKNLYKKMHPNASFENRIECLYNLKSLGYETGTGVLVGLEGQNIESLADDILFFKKLNADMIGIGPFIPHPDTPLKDKFNKNAFNLALKVMAITRIILPDINIPATTAMETFDKNGRIIALNSGANVIMPNINSEKYAKNYQIYPDKAGITDDIIKTRKLLEEKLNSIGRYISKDKGFRK